MTSDIEVSALTIKQEKFCRVYLEIGNASEAYRRAYDAEKMNANTINRSAFELLKNRKIAARLDVLKAELARKSEVTMHELVKSMRLALQMSQDAGKGGELGENVMRLAKLAGLIVDKSESVIKHEDQLAQILEAEEA